MSEKKKHQAWTKPVRNNNKEPILEMLNHTNMQQQSDK